MQFPEGKNITGYHAFSTDILEKSLKAIFNAKREVSGFLRICCGANGIYFLFFLKNSVCGAGKYFDHRPDCLTVKEFFSEVISCNPVEMVASLHEADPMLISDFLTFFRDEPTLKAPVSMIDLDSIVRQITREKSDALVVLESEDFFNFFHFKNGVPVKSSFSEICDEVDGLSVEEQLLLYAYRPEKNVDAYTFRDIAANESAESCCGSQMDILNMLDAVLNPVEELTPEAHLNLKLQENGGNAPSATKPIRIAIIDGVDKGTNISLNIPFIVGRKEGDLIIADPLVSRRHAIVKEIGGLLAIEDLGSTNGTFVNGVEIKMQQIANGDLIKVGSSVFQILPD